MDLRNSEMVLIEKERYDEAIEMLKKSEIKIKENICAFRMAIQEALILAQEHDVNEEFDDDSFDILEEQIYCDDRIDDDFCTAIYEHVSNYTIK